MTAYSHVVVVGDTLIDEYVEVRARRHNAQEDEYVPVVSRGLNTTLPGGAAAVAHLLGRWGVPTRLVTRTGVADHSQVFGKVDVLAAVDQQYWFPVKTRYVSRDGRLRFRVDHEKVEPFAGSYRCGLTHGVPAARDTAERLLKTALTSVNGPCRPLLVVSDYAKGFMDYETWGCALREAAAEYDLLVDPPPDPGQWRLYQCGAKVLKINRQQAMEVMGKARAGKYPAKTLLSSEPVARLVANDIWYDAAAGLEEMGLRPKWLWVTLGCSGSTFGRLESDGPKLSYHYPVEPAFTAGAGDVALAAFAAHAFVAGTQFDNQVSAAIHVADSAAREACHHKPTGRGGLSSPVKLPDEVLA